MVDGVTATLFVVNGSHPCVTVERALELKGIEYKTVEWPPPMHAPLQRVIFGKRTVPGLRMDGEKISGSRAILRRLEELRPEPALFPADAHARAKVEEAERWGDEVFQPIARRILWPALKRDPKAMPSFTEGSRIPLPAPAVRLSAPLITRAEIRLNKADEAATRADLEALPGYLDRIDAWIEEGVLGGERPNAADLQIAPTLQLLMTVGDIRPLIAERPAGRFAVDVLGEPSGHVPAGTLPREWLPAAARP
jgi:glutathione S-transferase